MSFFQNSVLQNYIKTIDDKVVEAEYEKFKNYFHDPKRQENIRNSKEEQFQEGFLRELFVKVLGYTLNPEPDFNLTTELKNEKGAKKTDGAILKDDKALGVIELKGTDTKDLDKVNEQAFNYKNNHSACVYVITSNFEKLRFFIHNSVEHLEFNLFTLSLNKFKVLWLCLQSDNLLSGIPLKVKEESLLAEENITKQLYKDYSAFKRDMWHNMVKNHPKDDQLMLFKKTQKLLDRFLFIFFSEDSGLLPPNSISKIIDKWTKDTDWGDDKKLYDVYKQYFGFIDSGRPARGDRAEIFGYNGGLFQEDLILDRIKIDDEILLKHTKKLTAYDFQSEVDVNILGHIFENSLNEIENITAELEGQEIDKSKTKRKKDGVFYTPKYITKYIVDNTVGKLCEEKKAELKITDERFGQASKRSKKGIADLEVYRNWLLDLKICDPACGSGAFLNQALEFLMDEHRYLDELTAQYHKSPLVLSDIETHILEQNIYGVDINEESVEIAKLSLWLRTAQSGRKLTSLNNNIKCGNSLIDDPKVAGEKAFNWQKEFPNVFERGGFDVVIGNPPYVVYIRSIIGDAVIEYINKEYQFSEYNPNTYALFTDLALNNLLKPSGSMGFIIPNSWLDGQYFSKMRKGVYSNRVDEIVYLKDSVFNEVVETVILLCDNVSESVRDIKLSTDVISGNRIVTKFDANKFIGGYNPFITLDNPFLEKLETRYKKLGAGATVYRGLETRNNKKWLSEKKESDFHVPILLGRDVSRYFYEHSGTFVKFIKSEMKSNANEAMYKKPKILMRRTGSSIIATIEQENLFALKNLYLIIPNEPEELYSMIAQINSKLMAYYHRVKSSGENKAFAQFKGVYVEGFPYVNCKDVVFKNKIEKTATEIGKLYTLKKQFIELLQSKFDLDKLSKKLQNWYELEFKDFLKELRKAKIQLELSEEAEWMQYFNEQKEKAQKLKAEIDKIDKEIDKMVYELYGLTQEEIKIVEGN